MLRFFCLLVVVSLIIVQFGYAESKPYSQMSLGELVAGNPNWENVKVKDATLGELSDSINRGVKWGMLEYSFIMLGIVLVASFAFAGSGKN